jgi:hypothetical protein
MNLKSMIVGLVIAVVASTGTYFLLPPPSGAEASSCATKRDVKNILGDCLMRMSARDDETFYFLC